MTTTPSLKNWPKFLIGWVLVFLIRLAPFRPPNVEPVLTTLMPFSKKFGWLGGFAFGFLSIMLFDTYQGYFGQWTIITGIAYGLLGVGGYFFFKKRGNRSLDYVKFAIVGTLLYDAVTGLTIGPLMFGQSFAEAFYGQIPFTAMHLASNIILAATLSPLMYRWVVANDALSPAVFLKRSQKIT